MNDGRRVERWSQRDGAASHMRDQRQASATCENEYFAPIMRSEFRFFFRGWKLGTKMASKQRKFRRNSDRNAAFFLPFSPPESRPTREAEEIICWKRAQQPSQSWGDATEAHRIHQSFASDNSSLGSARLRSALGLDLDYNLPPLVPFGEEGGGEMSRLLGKGRGRANNLPD